MRYLKNLTLRLESDTTGSKNQRGNWSILWRNDTWTSPRPAVLGATVLTTLCFLEPVCVCVPVTSMTSSAVPCQHWLTTHTWANAAKVSSHLRSSTPLCFPQATDVLHRTVYYTALYYKLRHHEKRLNKYIGYKERCFTTRPIHPIFLFLHSSVIHSCPTILTPPPASQHLYSAIFITYIPVWAGLDWCWMRHMSGHCFTHTQTTPTANTLRPSRASALSWGFDVNGHSGNSWWTTGPMNGQEFVMALSTPEPTV